MQPDNGVAIGTFLIPRETLHRSDDLAPGAYAPPVRDWNVKYDIHVEDPGYQVYFNHDWRTEHHNLDQLIKIGLRNSVGPQYVIADVRRGPRVTFLVANPYVPSREDAVGEFSQEEVRGRIGDAAYIDRVPNVVRRDRRVR